MGGKLLETVKRSGIRNLHSDPAFAFVFLSDICLPIWHISLVTIQRLTWLGSKEKTEPAAWRARP